MVNGIAPLPISFNPDDFTSDFLIGSVGRYNTLTEGERSLYTDQYDDSAAFEPLKVDPESFDVTMNDTGFKNYVTGRKAFGPTVHVNKQSQIRAQREDILEQKQGESPFKQASNVPSPEEFRKRISEGTELLREGEALPKYDALSGRTPQEFWSQYPSFASVGGGLEGTLFGDKTEENTGGQATPTPIIFSLGAELRKSTFSPGGHQGGQGKHAHSTIGNPLGNKSPTPPGLGWTKYGGKIGKKAGGKIDDQMSTLSYKEGSRVRDKSNRELTELEQDFVNRIKTKDSKISILRNKQGQFLGAVDLNDVNNHAIVDMDALDLHLGILKSHEMAMARDPRMAGQFDRKRNWANRIERIQQSRRKAKHIDEVFAYRDDIIPTDEAGLKQALSNARKTAQDTAKAAQQAANQLRKIETKSTTKREPVQTERIYQDPRLPLLGETPLSENITGVEQQRRVQDMEDALEKQLHPTHWRNIRQENLSKSMGFHKAITDARETAQNIGKVAQDAADQARGLADNTEDQQLELTEEQEFEVGPDAPGGAGTRRGAIIPQKFNRNVPWSGKIGMQEGGITPSDTTPFYEYPFPRNISPQEQRYLDFHRQNLDSGQGRENPDGSITTIYGKIMSDQEGTAYLIPGYNPNTKEDMTDQAAWDRANEIGLENFPSAENVDLMITREEELKKIINQDMKEYYKNMQAGGQVPQINKSGLIQGEGGPTSDSIPMKVETDSFIVNAPAVEMVGKQKLDSMVNGVQKQQSVSGFNQPNNSVTGAQGINVSNGEYKVSKKDAQKIGYDTLNNINDAGKPFVAQLDQEGFANGGQIEDHFKNFIVPAEFNKAEYKNPKKYNSATDEYVAYKDTRNYITFGPGVRDYKNAKVGDRRSKPEVDKEARKRWKAAIRSAKKLLNIDNHRIILPIAEMVYQMGEGFSGKNRKGVRGFKKMLKAISIWDIDETYRQALASDWASKKQTPERAREVAARLKEAMRRTPIPKPEITDQDKAFVSDPAPLKPAPSKPASFKSNLPRPVSKGKNQGFVVPMFKPLSETSLSENITGVEQQQRVQDMEDTLEKQLHPTHWRKSLPRTEKEIIGGSFVK